MSRPSFSKHWEFHPTVTIHKTSDPRTESSRANRGPAPSTMALREVIVQNTLNWLGFPWPFNYPTGVATGLHMEPGEEMDRIVMDEAQAESQAA